MFHLNDQPKIPKLDDVLQTFLFYFIYFYLFIFFKKELENFIQAKFEDYNLGRTSQKALRIVPPVRRLFILQSS